MIIVGEIKKVGVMTYDVLGPAALDYLPCRYGNSKLLFRGPLRSLDDPYIAFIGGTETYGKFISRPFADLVEDETGLTSVNFGLQNAGVDVFSHDPFVVNAAAEARMTVVQVMGAQNMTNRFYSVHPRRNDRFVGASQLLQTIYREVDFAEFHFTKHMLQRLRMVSPERFAAVRQELQDAWLARMRLLLGQLRGKSVLLWFADHAPANGNADISKDLGSEPLFVTREMMDKIAPFATEVVEVTATQQAIAAGTEGMVFSEMESMAAQQILGPIAHTEAAQALSAVMSKLL